MHKYCVILILLLSITLGTTGCVKNPAEEGVLLLQEHKYKEAIQEFEKAVEKEINIADAYRGIGIAKWELRDYEGARDSFQKALKNEAVPTATLYNFLGVCELQLNNHQKALSYFRIGMAAECSEELLREMRYNEIVCFEALGEWESAKAKLQEYVADYPDDERASKEAEFLETR